MARDLLYRMLVSSLPRPAEVLGKRPDAAAAVAKVRMSAQSTNAKA
jgi:hypothetical protein